MPSVSAPFGFRAESHPSGRTNASNAYQIASGYAVNIFSGDAVKGQDAGVIQIATSDGTRSGTAGGIRVLGIFAGVQYRDATGKPCLFPYWLGGTTATDVVAYVYDDVETRFEVQYTNPGTPGTTSVQTAVFEQCDWTGFSGTGGSIQTGQSSSYLGAIESSGTGQFQIIGFSGDVNQSLTDAYVIARVRINEHAYKAETPSI